MARFYSCCGGVDPDMTSDDKAPTNCFRKLAERHHNGTPSTNDSLSMESTRERVAKLCREKCRPRRCKGAGSTCAKILLVLVNFSFLVSGVALVLMGVWLHINRDSLFYTYLMRVTPRFTPRPPSSSSAAAAAAASNNVNSPVAASSSASASSMTSPTFLSTDLISVDSSPFVLIAAGSCITIVGFLGCCGACAESVCFLGFYSVLTMLIIIAEAAIIAVSSGVRRDLSERLLENLQHQIQFHYNVTAQRTNLTSSDAYRLTLAWNSLQTYLNCCGATGPQDFLYSAWFNHTRDFTGVFVPSTCCQLEEPDPLRPRVKNENLCQVEAIVHTETKQPIMQLHTQGCHDALIHWIEGYEHLVVSVLCILVVLQVLNVIFACLLINWIRKKHSDYTWCDVEEFE